MDGIHQEPPSEIDWVAEQPTTPTVASVHELAAQLSEASPEQITFPNSGDDEPSRDPLGVRFVWRGVGNRSFPLHPGMYRKAATSKPNPTEADVARLETDLLYSARKNLFGLRDGARLTDLELLAVLQHYGAATRLLDVSRNVLVALWFATSSMPDHSGREPDGVLFGIDVTGRTIAPRVERHRIASIVKRAGVLHWEPPPLELRIRAQQGSFILSRTKLVTSPSGRVLTSLDLRPLEVKAMRGHLSGRFNSGSARGLPAMIIFNIPGYAKARIRRELEVFYGQDEGTVFPDLEGFARSRKAP